jgi:hypothetical protein
MSSPTPVSTASGRWRANPGAALVDLFDTWGVMEAGLFTFAHGLKHIGLYQKFGFWPRFLTAVISKAVGEPGPGAWSKYSALPESEQAGAQGLPGVDGFCFRGTGCVARNRVRGGAAAGRYGSVLGRFARGVCGLSLRQGD